MIQKLKMQSTKQEGEEAKSTQLELAKLYLDPKKPVENIDDILNNIYNDFFDESTANPERVVINTNQV